MSAPVGIHSFGTEPRSCQLDGIRVSETLMPRGLRLGEHSHDAGQICFILEGEYRECAADGDHRLFPGRVQFHAPGESHANIFSSQADVLTLLISIDPDRWTHVSARRPVTPNSVLRECNHEIRRELRQIDDARRAALEGWALLSLSTLARQGDNVGTARPAWLNEAVAVIKQHATEAISLNSVATAVGVHRATLAAAFRRYKNISVGEYIRQLRVRRVMQELADTKSPLCEIALKCGFHDQAHMGLVFRKTVGVSPGVYRSRFS